LTTFFVPNWTGVYMGLAYIAGKIKSENSDFDAIVGLARGGWIPARILSDFLGIRRLISLQISSYDDLKRQEPKSLDQHALLASERKLLLVDDVADTGSSLIYAKNLLEKSGAVCKTAAIYVKPWTSFWPDYFFKEIREWVVFPWEILETVEMIVRRGYASYESAVEEIGLDQQLYDIVKPFLGDLDGGKDRLKKV